MPSEDKSANDMAPRESQGYAPVGTRVEICDGSEANGDKGVIWIIRNGVCVIALDAGCTWFVTDPGEYMVLKGE